MPERPEWKQEIMKRLEGLKLDPGREIEIVDELAQHLEEHYQELLARGVSEDEARRAALQELSDADLLAKELRRVEREVTPVRTPLGGGSVKNLLADLWQDVRYGLRQLRRNPGFTAVAIITLALGIGANTAIFSLVDAVLLRPLPYKNANRLTVIWQRFPKDRIGTMFDTYREFQVWKRHSQSFDKLAAATWARDAGAVLSWHGGKREILAVPSSVDFFSMLGVHATQGRTFEAEDLKNPCTVVLAQHFWQERLGGTPGWVGKSLILNGAACTVVGIMPKDFSFYPKQTELWTLITPDSAFTKRPWDMPMGVFGLLKPGVTPASAQAELATLENRIIGEKPDLAAMELQPSVLDLKWEFTWLTGRNLRGSVIILFATVIVVLLIACVNVANLLLGRAAERKKELGVRAALGSGRSRLIRQLLTESIVLSLSGALLGTLVAIFCVRYIDATEATQLPPGTPPSVNWEVLVFTAVLAVLTGILFGLVPAWKASRLDLNEVLKESGRTASRGALSQRTSRILVVAEMALSLVVLAAARLLIESAVRLTNAPLGFERDYLLTADLRLPSLDYPKAKDWNGFWDRLGTKVRSLPAVKGVAFSLQAPSGGEPVTIGGSPSWRVSSSIGQRPVSADYFRVMGIPLLQGREFDDRDRKKSMPVAIVNRALAGEFFPKGNAIGSRVKLGKPDAKGPWLTIVGVVGNVKHIRLALGYGEGPCVHRSLRQDPQNMLSIFVRTAGDPRPVERSVGRAVTAIDSNLPPPDVETMNQWLAQWNSQPKLRAVLFGIFAALALFLAVVGIYGVVSQLVAQRTYEVGIRVAFGAQHGDILRLIVGEGFKLTAAGVTIGIAGALALMRLLSNMLYGVRPTDPLTFVIVSLVLTGVALFACYIPARRATKVDPMVALRHE